MQALEQEQCWRQCTLPHLESPHIPMQGQSPAAGTEGDGTTQPSRNMPPSMPHMAKSSPTTHGTQRATQLRQDCAPPAESTWKVISQKGLKLFYASLKGRKRNNTRESSQDKIKCTSSQPQATLKIRSLGKNTK